jgi:N-acetyl-gamma-glutamyl-phosphate reductase
LKNENIKVGIIGATGYAGAELVRLLLAHPNATIASIGSVSFEGKKLSEVYPAYQNLCDMVCENNSDIAKKSDIVFAALPHGLSQDLAYDCYSSGKIFIDLGADFRLEDEDEYKQWYNGEFKHKALHKEAAYGLPELNRASIAGKKIIANPGCYTTCVPLGLAPALKNGLVEQSGIICDCKSGVTGAGRGLSQNTHFAELNEGLAPYKVATHRHTPEIEQTLSKLCGDKITLTFVPHLLPVNRGILATCYSKVKSGVTFEQICTAYEEAYKNEFFVRLLAPGKCADIHNVRYSNFCDISLHFDERTNTLITVSALDNMVKGAAGQAIQNMNILFDLPEETGLTATPPAF